jgi:FkbH-like protein
LTRVAELINRTSQFNIRGSRTSLQQVTAWRESTEHRILVAEARDKFGEMGIVSAMVLDLAEDALVISAWVLSCRVFGYGIETAMLNDVKRLGRRLNRAVIKGQIVETSNNQPCRNVFAANGFNQQAGLWISATAAGSADPTWLEITVHEDTVKP